MGIWLIGWIKSSPLQECIRCLRWRNDYGPGCMQFFISIYKQEELFLAHALYECRFYKDGAADRARDMQMHVAVTGFLTQVGKELSLPLCEDMQAADQLEKHLKDIAKAHREGIHFQNEYREPMQKAYPVYYEAVKRNIYMLEHGIGYSCSEDDLTFILFHVVAIAERYYQSYQKPGVVVVCHTGIGTACFLAEQLKNNFNIRIVAITSRHRLEETMDLYDFDLVVSTVTLNLQGISVDQGFSHAGRQRYSCAAENISESEKTEMET